MEGHSEASPVYLTVYLRGTKLEAGVSSPIMARPLGNLIEHYISFVSVIPESESMLIYCPFIY